MELPITLPDFLWNMGGETRVTGTRVTLFTILFDYNEGDSAETLASNYPHIPLATMHKLIAFYLENKPQVDDFLTAYQAELDRIRATGSHVDLDDLRRRFAEKFPGRRPVIDGTSASPIKRAE